MFFPSYSDKVVQAKARERDDMETELLACRAALAERDKTIAELREEVAKLKSRINYYKKGREVTKSIAEAVCEQRETIAELREHVCTLDLEAKDNNTIIAGLVELVKELHGELDFYAVETYTPNSTVRAIESRPEVKAALEGK